MTSAPWRPIAHTITPCTALAFDPSQDLLFVGSPLAGVSSLFLPNINQRYTAFKNPGHGPISELTIDEKVVTSLSSNGVKVSIRRGLASWVMQAPAGTAFTSMVHTSAAAADLVLASKNSSFMPPHPDLLVVSASTGTVIRKVSTEHDQASVCQLARGSHMIAAGQSSGRITLRDPRSLKVEKAVDGHSGGLTVLEAEGHMLLSLGYTIKQGRVVADPLVKVFDIRNLRPLAPIPFPAVPSFVKIHPRSSSTVIIANASGQFQVSDMANPSLAQYSQAETSSYLTAIALSATGEALAFGDADGSVSLWTAGDDANFSRGTSEIEMPDIVEPPKSIDWRFDTPLNLIGMPYYTTPLLSQIPIEDWVTPHSPLFRSAAPTDPAIVANMRVVDRVGYAPNPRTTLRNQALPPLTKQKKGSRRLDVPHFVSQKDRQTREQSVDSVHGEGDDAERVPQHFRKVEIQYSKFGVEDFDFAFYNKTRFSGLETHIINSYTNALLQALHYLLPMRRYAEAHTRIACTKENCLLCELGFLCRMLGDAKGVNCQASNFSRAFTASSQAAALGLMDFEEISPRESYVSLIQTFNRFIIETTSAEADQFGPFTPLFRDAALAPPSEETPSPTPIAQLFGLATRTVSSCFHCHARTVRDSASTVLDLIYPRKALGPDTSLATRPVASDFCAVVSASIARETTTKTVCASCRQPTHLRVKRSLVPDEENAMMPPLLAINAGVHTSEHVGLWMDGKERFVKERIGLAKAGENVSVTDETVKREDDEAPERVVYELKALTVQVQTDEEAPHLVSIIRIPAEDLPADTTSPWYLFNDFLVRPISEDEALGFAGSWKIPAVLYYQRLDADTVLDLTRLPSEVDPAILFGDLSISKKRQKSDIHHQPLSRDELPQPGSLISIDAEFVSLQDEEVEYRSNGPKKVIRPKRMSLARVSVLRGEGESTGVPFIDDYIHTSEPIVDYLTEFSGIRAGDLDPNASRHTLVPLKVAYKKLRLLVDLGCVFIGHGLAKDFRIINVHIPRAQIIDTVDIYHLPARQRKLSLRFLAYAVLQSDVQGGGTHDSIEDARTALQLYEAYRRLEVEGRWEDALEDIYLQGAKLLWKVPSLTATEMAALKPLIVPEGSIAAMPLPPA